jgi:hypothetical protein
MTDDSGQQQNSMNVAWQNGAYALMLTTGPLFYSYGTVVVLHSKAGAPIGITVTGGQTYSTTYNVIVTVERLTNPQ